MTLQFLPIDPFLPELGRTLSDHNCLIVQAPPGSGKTTRVAPLLLELTATPGCIALIQPRRIAARAAAARIAAERGGSLGKMVGYQVRFDSQCGPDTRLISMTPGILLRRLQSDPTLDRFSAIVLDEFHERSVEMDLLLGILRRLQVDLRPELRIVVMSATLNAQEIANYLGHPPQADIPTQCYPVHIRYQRFEPPARTSITRKIVQTASQAILQASQSTDGDMLVFLPGVGEIMQVKRDLEPQAERSGWDLLTLYGDLPPEYQDQVLQPGSRRRVILSTNVAETSLTIDGIRVVVDSGWARVKRFDPASGLDALQLEPISQASADQRAGRAGRTAPGVCFRLWDEITGRSRSVQLPPEILRTDLTGPVLQLLGWGESPEHFNWLTAPSPSAVEQARGVLQQIGAVAGDKVTALGRLLLKFPLQPRLARLLVESHRLGVPASGCMAAALLGERDLFLKPQDPSARAGRGGRTPPTTTARQWSCDVTQRVLAWQRYQQDHQSETVFGTVNHQAARNLASVSRQYLQIVEQELGPQEEERLDDQLQRALLEAFPDRLARRRSPSSHKGLMVGGKGVQLDSASGVRDDLFLCLDADGGGTEAKVRWASGIDSLWLTAPGLREGDERFFNPTTRSVVTRRCRYWHDLVLDEQPAATPLDRQTAELLAREAAAQFDRLLPAKDKQLHSLLDRLRWLSAAMPDADLPQFDIPSLAGMLVDWCVGLRSLAEVQQLPWNRLIDSLLSTSQRRLLDQHAPPSIRLPAGREQMLQYEPGKSPVLAARIQELFGWSETPKLAGGRVPLTLHLLAPNGRCQQITNDLASFWKNTYPVVRKELRGRYPKHDWPEDPLHDR
ncbi:MAG: ATP-dependent helicase HrpB [Pirellulaceae bacterium]|nr:ATP-dependent helicase HrpB [Pirellulaceae bacterium]